jgi:hypothetical protein
MKIIKLFTMWFFSACLLTSSIFISASYSSIDNLYGTGSCSSHCLAASKIINECYHEFLAHPTEPNTYLLGPCEADTCIVTYLYGVKCEIDEATGIDCPTNELPDQPVGEKLAKVQLGPCGAEDTTSVNNYINPCWSIPNHDTKCEIDKATNIL